MKITSTIELTRTEVTAVTAFQKRLKQVIPSLATTQMGEVEIKGALSFSNILYKLRLKDTAKVDISIDYNPAYVIDSLELMDSFIKEIVLPAMQLVGKGSEFREKLSKIDRAYPMDKSELETTGELEEVDLDDFDIDLNTIYSDLKDELKNN